MKPEKRTCPTCGKTKPTTAYAPGEYACRVCVALPPPNTRKTVEAGLRRAYDRMHVKARVSAKMGKGA